MAITRLEEAQRREELRSLGRLAFYIIVGTGAIVLLDVLLRPEEEEVVQP